LTSLNYAGSILSKELLMQNLVHSCVPTALLMLVHLGCVHSRTILTCRVAAEHLLKITWKDKEIIHKQSDQRGASSWMLIDIMKYNNNNNLILASDCLVGLYISLNVLAY